MEFVTIAYKTPYYEETACIYYDNSAKTHIIYFKDNQHAVIEKRELEKGEADINGDVWKFTKVI